MKLKWIIFDGDGVLFDTEKLYVLAWKSFLPSYNINLASDDFEEGVGVEDTLFLQKISEKIKKVLNIYILTSKKLNILPENIIAFEDSETGIKSAKSTGIFCVGIFYYTVN
ncbi:MAG: HAD family hydrolase [Candidatus Omnitrophica bacterium]|nr:HAD family hydrolase [Candidatus Omnitrophota bacterium]